MERRSEKLAQAFMQYKEGELSKEAYIEMKDDRNNWKVFCEDRKKSLEQTIRKLEKQQKKKPDFYEVCWNWMGQLESMRNLRRA